MFRLLDKKIIAILCLTKILAGLVYRVHTDLKKSLNLTLVLENFWNSKKVPFFPGVVLEICKIILKNMG